MNTKYFIKIYGERNSGTKYLERLIAMNLDCHILRGTEPQGVARLHYEWLSDLFFYLKENEFLGWKHSIPNIIRIKNFSVNNPLLILTIAKNPYAYLLSLFDRPHHRIGRKSQSFQEFLSQPWRTRYRDHCPNRLNNPIELWNIKNKSYIDINDNLDNVVNITYEELIADPEQFIYNISKNFKIRKNNSFQNILHSTNNDSNKGFNELKRYYLEKDWRKRLTSKNVKTINKSICIDIVNHYNYQLL